MQKTNSIKTIKDLRLDLIEIFQDLKSDNADLKKAHEQSNMAGKIINTAKTQVQYNQFMDRKVKIDFLNC